MDSIHTQQPCYSHLQLCNSQAGLDRSFTSYDERTGQYNSKKSPLEMVLLQDDGIISTTLKNIALVTTILLWNLQPRSKTLKLRD